MKKLFISFLIILIIIVSCVFFWWNIAPANPSDKSQKIFVVSQGENIRDIGAGLEKAGLIKNATAFFLWVKWQKLDNKMQSGDFRLSPSQSLATLTKNLTHGSLDYWLTIPPGKRAEEIADILQKKAPNYTASWRQKLDANEGYLYPDSYLIPTSNNIDEIIALIRKNFDDKYATIASTNISKNQIVIVASILEREANSPEDKTIVASVLYNRLKIDMPLQSDPTISYGLGYDAEEHTWWKEDLTVGDLQNSSPYNTNIVTGLPPTPICNPGLSSLQAAAHPAQTDYLYYLSDKTGRLHFAKTLDQHNANIQKYNVE